MLKIVSRVWPLFLALSFLMVGNGLQGPLLGLYAAAKGFNMTTIGFFMSLYYAGFVAASFLMPSLVKQAGHIRVFAAFASIASSIILIHAIFSSFFLWVFLRFLAGFAIAALYVVVESWLNDIASNKTRGRLLGMYTACAYASLAFGHFSLIFVDPMDVKAFILVSVLFSLSLVPISLGKRSQPSVDSIESMSIASLYTQVPLGVVACLLTGMAQGAFMGMGAVYGDALGIPVSQIGFLFSLPLAAVVLTQFPVGALSDLFDRRLMIAVLSLIVAFCGGLASIISTERIGLLVSLFTLYGSLSVPLYSLSLAHANDVLPSSRILSASSCMVFVYGLGSVIGPFVVGVGMQFVAPVMFFVLGTFIHLFLCFFSIFRMRLRPAPVHGDRAEFVSIGVRGTPIAAAAALEETQESGSS